MLDICSLLNIVIPYPITPFTLYWQPDEWIPQGVFHSDSGPFADLFNRTRAKLAISDISHIEQFYSLFQKMPKRNQDSLLSASRFFRDAKLKIGKSKVVDLMSAMESVFLNEDENQELSYRLSLRFALFTSSEESVRQSNRDLVKRLYNYRSKYVHGGDMSKFKNFNNDFNEGLKIFSDVCWKMLENKTIPNWNEFELDN